MQRNIHLSCFKFKTILLRFVRNFWCSVCMLHRLYPIPPPLFHVSSSPSCYFVDLFTISMIQLPLTFQVRRTGRTRCVLVPSTVHLFPPQTSAQRCVTQMAKVDEWASREHKYEAATLLRMCELYPLYPDQHIWWMWSVLLVIIPAEFVVLVSRFASEGELV
jgi:hypothetical protein